MKGDFSRLTGLKAKRKHYNGVLKQQGRVQLDSDWNELIQIITHQRKTRTIDTIGYCGAPIHSSGFQILHPGNGLQDLLITTGRFYAGGLLCETSPSSKLTINNITAAGTISVDDTQIEGILLEVGHWVQIITEQHPQGIIGKLSTVGNNGKLKLDQDISSLAGDTHPYLRRLVLFSEQVDFPQPTAYNPVVGQTDLFYLDVWERHITSIEDPLLREVALGGPDTDTRSKIISQVKFLPNVGDVNCEDETDSWDALTKIPNGRLTTRLVEPADPTDPCQLGESGGFLGLENHLYRVEVHEINNAGTATFKWSRDNASFAYGIKEFFDDGGAIFKIDLRQNGKDEFLKIKQQDWIEVSGEDTDLDTENAGTLAKVLKVEGTILTLDTDVSAHKDEAFPKVRRWEISNQRPNVTTNIVAGTGFQLEDGIEIEFSGTEFKVGDYWVFSARTLTGEIEILDKAAPLGIKHHYCKLAIVTGINEEEVEIQDCRPEFPPLTELPDTGGCCTVTVGEFEEFQDIQMAIDSLNGGPGEVCVKPGLYEIDQPINIRGNDITIRGCEGTPIITNTAQEQGSGAIFRIEDSRDIVIRDFWCLSLEGAQVITIENSLFFTLHNCMLVGAGVEDLAGVITCAGLTVNTQIFDNIILGMAGIRYDRDEEQSLNLHLNARIEKNILFALQTGIVQSDETFLFGFDVIDNLMLGFNIELMSKSFFPESLFAAAKKSNLYSTTQINRAGEKRDKGAQWAAISKKETDGIHNLNRDIKSTSFEAKSNASYARANNETGENTFGYLTIDALIKLDGMLIDGNINDNILIGNDGISSFYALELAITHNLILVQQVAIGLHIFEGATIENNYVTCGSSAIVCYGQIIFGLTISNNRLLSQQNGVIFIQEGDTTFQYAFNIQIDKNIISATTTGIALSTGIIFLFDFTVIDNSITGCNQAAIILKAQGGELQTAFENVLSLQRVIQRNSIFAKGVGIDINLPSCKLLDNDINHDPENEIIQSRGIIVRAGDCTINGNTIQTNLDGQGGGLAFGGILLEFGFDNTERIEHRLTQITNNKIMGGMGNGIEIASNITGLVIEENQISQMELNGIAVQSKVSYVDELRIKGNYIQNCNRRISSQPPLWWKYAGIVLTSTRKTQIIGNVICDNGTLQNTDTLADMGAIYAERINEITISNNQFSNNGTSGPDSLQAVIHVPIRSFTQQGIQINADIQITNNIVKGLRSAALNLGNFSTVDGVSIAVDHKAVISNNQFESSYGDCIVLLSVSQCVFSGNYASNDQSNTTVSILYGVDVIANGNITSGPIGAFGVNHLIDNNLELS